MFWDISDHTLANQGKAWDIFIPTIPTPKQARCLKNRRSVDAEFICADFSVALSLCGVVGKRF